MMIRFSIALFPLFLVAGLMDFATISEAQEAYKQRDYNKSVHLLESLKKDSPSYYYDLGNSYYKAKNYSKAIEAYKRAKGEGVDEHSRLHNLGNSYFKSKKLKEAVVAYETALKIKDDAQTKYNLELTKKLLEQKKKKKAQKQNQNKNNQNGKKKQNKESQKKDSNNKKNSNKQNRKNSKSKNGEQKKDNQTQSNSQNKKKNSPNQEKRRTPEYKREPYERNLSPRSNKKGSKNGTKEARAEVRRAKTISEKELKRLMKKMRGKKMPTMMYRGVNPKSGRDTNLNPW
jgi:Ca-activated chloride channel family protein